MSDLRQQLQALTARWRNSKTYPADSSERAAWVNACKSCADELDALVRAASPPFDESSICKCGHHIDQHRYSLVKSEPKGRWDCNHCACEEFRAASPPAPPIDTDVVRGRVNGAAGGVRSAGPPQEETPEQELARLRIEVADLSHDLKACIERESAGGVAGPQAPPVFTVEVDDDGCSKCSRGKTWAVLGPDDLVSSQSWAEEEDAQHFADKMNRAYELGQISARGDAARVPPSQEPFDADDIGSVAAAIDAGVYATDKITPSIRQLARAYLALRVASVPPATPQEK